MEYKKEKKQYIAQFMKMGIPREQAAKKAEWQISMNKKIELINDVAEFDHEHLWYVIKLMEQTGSSLEDALDWLRDIELDENEDCWNIESLKKDYQDALLKKAD